jgi:hypothetical protein
MCGRVPLLTKEGPGEPVDLQESPEGDLVILVAANSFAGSASGSWAACRRVLSEKIDSPLCVRGGHTMP